MMLPYLLFMIFFISLNIYDLDVINIIAFGLFGSVIPLALAFLCLSF